MWRTGDSEAEFEAAAVGVACGWSMDLISQANVTVSRTYGGGGCSRGL